jgi:hypothetical protein
MAHVAGISGDALLGERVRPTPVPTFARCGPRLCGGGLSASTVRDHAARASSERVLGWGLIQIH